MSAQPIKLSKYLLGLLLASASLSAYALKSDVEQPVQIEANTATFDKNAGTATYDGNVIIKQGSLEILAAHIEITAPDNKITLIIATGAPAHLKQQMDDGKLATGQGNEIQYFVTEKRLELNGNAQLTQDKDKFSSNHIVYLPNSGQLNADGGGSKAGRVSATLYPTNKTAP